MTFYISDVVGFKVRYKVHYPIAGISQSLTTMLEYVNCKIDCYRTGDSIKINRTRTGGKTFKFRPYIIIRREDNPKFVKKLYITAFHYMPGRLMYEVTGHVVDKI